MLKQMLSGDIRLPGSMLLGQLGEVLKRAPTGFTQSGKINPTAASGTIDPRVDFWRHRKPVAALAVERSYMFIFAISRQDASQRRHSSAQAFIAGSSPNFSQLAAQLAHASAHRPQAFV
jgi:hypothetical protein